MIKSAASSRRPSLLSANRLHVCVSNRSPLGGSATQSPEHPRQRSICSKPLCRKGFTHVAPRPLPIRSNSEIYLGSTQVPAIFQGSFETLGVSRPPPKSKCPPASSVRTQSVASELSRQLHKGGWRASVAAFRLKQRQRALKGITQSGWEWRLERANEARRMKRKGATNLDDSRQKELPRDFWESHWEPAWQIEGDVWRRLRQEWLD